MFARAALAALICLVAIANGVEPPGAFYIVIGDRHAAWPWDVTQEETEFTDVRTVESPIGDTTLHNQSVAPVAHLRGNCSAAECILEIGFDVNLGSTWINSHPIFRARVNTVARVIGLIDGRSAGSFRDIGDKKFIKSVNHICCGLMPSILSKNSHYDWAGMFNGLVQGHERGGDPCAIGLTVASTAPTMLQYRKSKPPRATAAPPAVIKLSHLATVICRSQKLRSRARCSRSPVGTPARDGSIALPPASLPGDDCALWPRDCFSWCMECRALPMAVLERLGGLIRDKFPKEPTRRDRLNRGPYDRLRWPKRPQRVCQPHDRLQCSHQLVR